MDTLLAVAVAALFALVLGHVIVFPLYLAVRFLAWAARKVKARSPLPARWRALTVAWALSLCLLIVLIMIPLYANVGSRARLAKAHADTRALASAATMYAAHMGAPPPTLTVLTSKARNAKGETAGPFFARLPSPPAGFTEYQYQIAPDRKTFTISTSSAEYGTVTAP